MKPLCVKTGLQILIIITFGLQIRMDEDELQIRMDEDELQIRMDEDEDEDENRITDPNGLLRLGTDNLQFIYIL